MTQFSKLIASALIAACFAVPAQAADEQANSSTQATAAMSATAAAPQAAEKKYCIVERLTGSRMPSKICRTKAEWSAEGVDVSKAK